MSDRVQPVTSSNLPSPVGPYSPGVVVGNLVFVSGQAGREPGSGRLAPDVEAQTEQVLKNIATILEAAGSGLQHVVRCGVWLDDPRDFWSFNAVYKSYFGDHPPARACVQSHMMVDCKVEIDCVAYKGP